MDTEENNKSFMRKIMKCRKAFQNLNVTKTGYNKFHNFNYYTLEDILHAAYPILEEHELCTWYGETSNKMKLVVMDIETGFTKTLFIDKPELIGKNFNDLLQNIGKRQSYLRRYLWTQLFDIVEPDPDKDFKNTSNEHVRIKPVPKVQPKPKQIVQAVDTKKDDRINKKLSIGNTGGIKEIEQIARELTEKNRPHSLSDVKKYLDEHQENYSEKEYRVMLQTIEKINN